MKRILYVAQHRRDRSPSQRFRFDVYEPYLKQQGFEVVYAPLLSIRDDEIFYTQGRYAGKAGIFIKSALRRTRDVLRSGSFDVVLISREAFMTGTTLFERAIKRAGARIVYDFDDAVWSAENASSPSSPLLAWLKRPQKTAHLIAISDAVLAGNRYLAAYAERYNDHVHILPTVIDTDAYVPAPRQVKFESVCIGWSGSFSTIRHFSHAVPVLKRLKQKYGDLLSFKVIGDRSFRDEDLGIQGIDWNRQTEIADLSSLDIGIMPLPDDEWSKGKCGLKGLQYMALEIPTVMSPVGVNCEIINDSENGFLASTEQEWMNKLSLLIESPDLRRRLGAAGRRTVEQRYSLRAQRDRLVSILNDLVEREGRFPNAAHRNLVGASGGDVVSR